MCTCPHCGNREQSLFSEPVPVAIGIAGSPMIMQCLVCKTTLRPAAFQEAQGADVRKRQEGYAYATGIATQEQHDRIAAFKLRVYGA